MKKQKFLSVMGLCLLAVTVLVSMALLLPTKASAATSGYYTYWTSNGEAYITDCNTSISGDITVPSRLGGCTVVEIRYRTFASCDKITSVTIPNCVRVIDSYVFSTCNALKSVYIGSGVTEIRENAFSAYNTSLEGIWVSDANTVYSSDSHGALFNKDKTTLIKMPDGRAEHYTIPDSVTTVDAHAFNGCEKLPSLTIPSSVTSIGEAAFSSCRGLTEITIPESVTSIGYDAFHYCEKLTAIRVAEGNPNYSSDSYGVLFNKDKTTLIKAPGGISQHYTIPDGVTAIAEGEGFNYCFSLPSLTIPSSVKTIGGWVFDSCFALTSIVIPDGVQIVGKAAFQGCSNLTCVTIGSGMQAIDEWTFNGCFRMTEVTFGSQITSIGENAFYGCSALTTVYYGGTQSQWSGITIGANNEKLTAATVQYSHTHDYTTVTPVTVAPSCTEDGYVEYTCVYGETYREALGALGHRVTVETTVLGDPLTISNTGYEPFTLTDGVYYSTNHSDNSSSAFTATAKSSCTLKLTYGVSSEQNYDKFFIWLNGSQKDVISGSVTGRTLTLTLAAGDVVTFRYTKDVSQSKGEDRGWVKLEYNYVPTVSAKDVPAESLEPDCTSAVICTYCGYTVKEAKGHRTLTEVLTVENNADVPFTVTENTFYSANHNNSSSSEFTVTALQNCELTLRYGVSSESSYDKFWLFHNGNYLDLISGSVPQKTAKITVTAGDVFTFRYTKDGSQSAGEDRGWVTFDPGVGLCEVPTDDIAPTCTTSVICSYCSAVAKAATGHSYVEHAAAAPTCTQIGWDAYTSCASCDYTTYAERSALGHSFTNYISDDNASCLTDCTQTAKCERCDVTDTLALPDTRLGHMFVNGICIRCENATDLYTYVVSDGKATVTACDTAVLGAITIPDTLGGYPVTAIGTNAFSGCAGLTNVIITDSVTTVGANAFSGCEKLAAVTLPSGITSIGEAAFDGCGALTEVYYSGDQSQSIDIASGNDRLLAATWNYQHIHDHTLFPPVRVEPTCEAEGYIEYTCIFGETYRETLLALGHDYSGTLTVAPTCEAEGYTQVYCSRCGAEESREAISALGHDYSGTATVFVPNCLESGYTVTQCIRCESTETTDPLPALGHACTELVLTVAPTCLEGGYSTYKCVRCDETNTTDYVSNLGHDYSEHVHTAEPTCLEGGYTTYKCVRCDETNTADPVAALGHDYSGTVTVVAPTCQSQGYTLTQCIRCDSTETSSITNVVAHRMVILPSVNPTCTEPGLTIGSACQWCGKIGVAQKEVAATGHTLVDHEAKAPTCTEVGWEAYQTCENCDHSTYVEIPARHSYADYVCTVCGRGRVTPEITSVALRPSCSGLYFNGNFVTDGEITVLRQGIAVSIYSQQPMADGFDPASLYTMDQTSVLIANILSSDEKNGMTPIYARAYALMEDGTYIYGDVVSINLKAVVEAISGQWDSLTAAQQSALTEMYRQNTSAMQDWTIPSIKEALGI